MKKIFNVILAGLVLAAVVYFAGEQGWLENTPLKNFDHKKINIFSQEASEQTKVLTSRAKETGSHVQNILGDKVEVDEEQADEPLHEKTIEYAQYLYCKQVVDDFEGS